MVIEKAEGNYSAYVPDLPGRTATGGRECAVWQTTIRAAWEEGALYLFAICVEPEPESVAAKVTKRDGSVWLEDAVEVFLQPKPPPGDYYHFVFNARGVYYDARGDDPAFDPDLDVGARDDRSSWRLEIAIPWPELGVGPPAGGDQWGFNVGREHRPVEPRVYAMLPYQVESLNIEARVDREDDVLRVSGRGDLTAGKACAARSRGTES